MAGVWPSNGALLMLWKDSGWVVQFAADNVGGVTSGASSVSPGGWHHAAYTRTGNNGTYTFYFDGEIKGQVASGTNNANTTIRLGNRADYVSQALNALLDEARISNAARSADWIKTQYNNQNSPLTFYTISASNNCCDTSTAGLDPLNTTGGSGENPLSQNFNWTLPLVSLPGRAGMDLNLSLSYNSLVWTKSGGIISFDDDRGFPGPGFRLGFPVIQPRYYNSEIGKYAFLLLGNDGSRTELRQIGTSLLYEAADSSHLLFDTGAMVLRTTDGTQLKYELNGSEYECTEIKDRNGNYITISYTATGRVDTITDTLARSIKFNYDSGGSLISITQTWNQGTANQVTHYWAVFDYTNTTIQTNFSGLTVSGPSNNSTIKTLAKVTLADGSHHDFSYTSWGQVWKVSYFSDAPVQHDNTNYSASFVSGRANLSSVRRYDVNNTAQFTTTRSRYDTAGAVRSTSDALNHTTQISYTDSFSDGVSRNTLAFPTTITDPDGYTSTTKYNFDFGALTYRQTPKPNITANEAGPETTFTYDSMGRLERTTSLVNNAYARYIYGPNFVRTFSSVNTVADEAHYLQVFDGAGRTVARAMNHPGSQGGFSGVRLVYDVMGRRIKQSNPTETSINMPEPAVPMKPSLWAASGDDNAWYFTVQTYDWKGRPVRTTHPDGKYREAAYSGCGCAGGEVVTLTDEGTIDARVAKRRQQKVYSDVFGRTSKIELLNWADGMPYSTTVTAYTCIIRLLKRGSTLESREAERPRTQR